MCDYNTFSTAMCWSSWGGRRRQRRVSEGWTSNHWRQWRGSDVTFATHDDDHDHRNEGVLSPRRRRQFSVYVQRILQQTGVGQTARLFSTSVPLPAAPADCRGTSSASACSQPPAATSSSSSSATAAATSPGCLSSVDRQTGRLKAELVGRSRSGDGADVSSWSCRSDRWRVIGGGAVPMCRVRQGVQYRQQPGQTPAESSLK